MILYVQFRSYKSSLSFKTERGDAYNIVSLELCFWTTKIKFTLKIYFFFLSLLKSG